MMAMASLAAPAIAQAATEREGQSRLLSAKASRAVRRHRDGSGAEPDHKYYTRRKAKRRAKKPNRLHISARTRRRHRRAKRAA
jgi:hypothetical protein